MSFGVPTRNGAALSLGTAAALNSGGPTRPSLALNLLSGSLDSRITYSRNSPATQYGSTGNLQYSPSNSVRNNTMVGVVAGTPGTAPNFWSTIVPAGVTQTIVGSGVENGIEYIDIRFAGTPSTSSYININPEIQTAAVLGQSWTGSFYAKLIAGSFTNSNANIEIRESDATQTFLTNTLTTITVGSTLQRYSQSRTLVSATVAFVRVAFVFQHTAGQAIDFTVRMGLPQLEIGNQLSPVIRTTNAVIYGSRIDYDPTSLVTQNLILQSQDLRVSRDVPGAPWTNVGDIVVGPSTVLCPDGSTSAYVLTDNSTSQFQGIQQNITVANNSQTYTASVFILKTTGVSQSVGLNLGLIGGTAVNNYPRIDTTAGTVISGTATISSYNNLWWRIQAPITNNSSGNTTLQLQLYPAVFATTATGSATFFGAQWNTGATALPYTQTTTAAVQQYAVKGLLVENTATNGIRNNTMQGAVAGTPGTVPTNWFVAFNSITGMSSSIIGTGVQNGVNYVDIRLFGTPSATVAQGIQIGFEGGGTISASASQIWSTSSWVSIVGGSAANITGFVLNTQQYNTGVFVQSNNVSFTPSSSWTRYNSTVTFSAAATTHALPLIGMGTTASAAIDITLRVGLPQCELGTYVSSVIPTFGLPGSRGRDEASVAVNASWYNQTAGTIIVEAVRDTIPAPGSLGASYGRFFSVSDGTLNNAYSCGTIAAQVNVYTAVTSGGVETMAFSSLPMTAGAITRCGLAISNASARMALNGTLSGASDSTCTMPTATTMTIGQRSDFSLETTWSGWIRTVNYYPLRLPNSTLQDLTA